ncbi:MAG: transglycosylase domain-containing protein, partial [bacterium]|nr:transglycosylase domain-containing protein [bacterium]
MSPRYSPHSKEHRRIPVKHMFHSLKASLAVIFLLGMLFVGMLVAWGAVIAIPSLDNFQNRKVAESTKIYDRTGNVLLYDVHGTMRRTAVPLDAISTNIRNATIAIEDTEFYQHFGFRPLSFARAALANIFSASFAQGGSTITQQVVKNSLLTRDKTIIRKMKEIVLSIKLERIYSKDQILSTYLNETSYGGTIYGVEEASQYFYGVPAKDVTLAEAAYIAALPQAPTRYSPYGNHREELEKRKNLVLERMRENGFITDAEYQTAKNETVDFKDEAEAGIKAPHFVFYVREYLEEKYGVDAVGNGGLKVTTTLDYDLQKKAEDVLSEAALRNEKNFNAS